MPLFAYQGGGRGFDLAMLTTLEHMVQTGPPPTPERLCEPDVTLWFDLPVGQPPSAWLVRAQPRPV